MNLEADQIDLVLQVRSDLTVEIYHIVKRSGDLYPVGLLDLAQPNCWRHDGSVEPSIFKGVIIMPTLRRLILEVGNYESIFSQISGAL